MNKVKLPATTVTKAYENFCELYYPTANGVGMQFWQFVKRANLDNVYTANDDYWLFEADVAHRIKMLAGPHYQTVAKIMEANGHRWQELENGHG